MNQLRKVLFLSLILIISACATEEQLPTLVPTAEPATAEPQEAVETETPIERPTFPPTWTFTPEIPTDTPTFTPTDAPTVEPTSQVQTVSPVCETFGADADLSQREFQLGTAPVVAWSPVAGAVQYRVYLYDSLGGLLRDDIYVAETQFAFDATEFEAGETYIWSAYPIDSNGDQMCFERGLELIPQ